MLFDPETYLVMRSVIVVENGKDDLSGFVIHVALSEMVPPGGLATSDLGARVNLLVRCLDSHKWAHRCHVAGVASKLCLVHINRKLAKRLRHGVLYLRVSRKLAFGDLANRDQTLTHLHVYKYY